MISTATKKESQRHIVTFTDYSNFEYQYQNDDDFLSSMFNTIPSQVVDFMTLNKIDPQMKNQEADQYYTFKKKEERFKQELGKKGVSQEKVIQIKVFNKYQIDFFLQNGIPSEDKDEFMNYIKTDYLNPFY